MNIFEQVKGYVTAGQAAEQYGIKINRNKMACCPFHNDRHPSMKVDKTYHCFACNAGGDAIDFTARMFGLTILDYPYRFTKRKVKRYRNIESRSLHRSKKSFVWKRNSGNGWIRRIGY